MPKLETIEYQKVLLRFGKNVHEVRDDTYQATKPDTPAKKRTAAIKLARAKVAEYDELLAQLEGKQREGAEKRFGPDVDSIREDLETLEKGAAK
jgi:hypothetical protein